MTPENLPSLFGAPVGSSPGDDGTALNLPVFPGPQMEKPETLSRQRDLDPGLNMPVFPGPQMEKPDTVSRQRDMDSELNLPVFPGPQMEKSDTMSRQRDVDPGLNMPVFPGLQMEKPDTVSRQRDMDRGPGSGDSLSGFSMLPGSRSGPGESGNADSLPAFPGHGVDKSPTNADQSSYPSVDILANLQNSRLDGGKVPTSKDRHRSSTASVSYETGRGASLPPIFPSRGEEKSGTHYPPVEIPIELKNLQLDGRKSVTADNCEHSTVASRFQESSSSAALSPAEHRSFPMAGNSAAFRADFWHRTSPVYMNDRLFLSGAANLRHFDVEFPRSSEPMPTNLAHRYSQSHSMMPGNFLGGVVDFRRLPPENPAVTSPQSDTGIPDASPLSLARYQRK